MGKTNPLQDKIHTSPEEYYDICPAGQYALAGDKCRNCTSTCPDCPPGSISLKIGSVECIHRPAGRYTSNSGSKVCLECSEGMFSSESGSENV